MKPALRTVGFDRFQGRHAWRRTGVAIDLVTFPSMNAYIADGVGCTSFSFSCEAGVYYPGVESDPVEWPRGARLTFRGFPGKTLRQPIFHPYGRVPRRDQEWLRDRPDVWYVLGDGSNLDEVVADALAAVRQQALPYIDEHDDPVRALHALTTEEGREGGFGRLRTSAAGIGSPRNLELIERLEAVIGRIEREG